MPDERSSTRRFRVALSFPGEKRDFVREVAEELGDALGRDFVFYDDWYEGELARANLDTYLQEIYGEQSDLVVPFFCADYANKSWCCNVEWRVIRAALNFDGRPDEFLMSMRFDDTPIKGLLRTDGYVDIGKGEPKRIVGLILDRLASMGLYDPPGTPVSSPSGSIHNLPFASLGPLFKGRENEMGDLAQALEAGGAAAVCQPQTLSGLGGVGKTRLAIEYAWRYRGTYTALLYALADSPENLHAGLASLCGRPVLDLRERDAQEQAIQVEAVLTWLRENPGWLLILDNADTQAAAQAVEALLPHLQEGRVVITSRMAEWSGAAHCIDLQVIPREDAVAFLMERATRRAKSDADEADAGRLADVLGCLPLALVHAAAYINHKHRSFARYIEEFAEQTDTDMAYHDERLMNYPRAIAITYEVTLNQLGVLERALVRLCAFLAPEAIPMFLVTGECEALRQAVDLLSQEAGAPPPEVLDIDEALAELNAYSMIAWAGEGASEGVSEGGSEGAFSIHRMVQEAVRVRIPEEQRRAWLECALKWVNDAAPAEPYDVRTWPIWDPLRPHAEAIAARADEAGIAEPTARLMSCLGELLHAKGLYPACERWKRCALTVAEAAYGPDHSNVAGALNNLAQLLQATNRLDQAEPLMRRALEIDEAVCGPDHPDVARDLNNLAQLPYATSRPDQAEPLMRRALEINEAAYGQDHPEVACHLSGLAALLHDTNRLAEAEPLMRRALEIDEAAYGPDHPNVAIHLNNLAQLLKDTSRLDQAEPLMRRVVTIFEESYGEMHPNVATALNNLAQLLKGTNRSAEAEPLIRRALEIDEAAYGQDHPNVATDLNNLALLLKDTNRLDEAEPLSRRHLEIFVAFTRATGHPHPHLHHAMNNYAGLLRKTGMPDDEIATRLRDILGDLP